MKVFAILTVILAAAFSAPAAPTTWQELTTHLFTNTTIIWEAPTNNLPDHFWIYQRLLPHVFTETVISNAIVLGSLQSKGFPQPSTNDFFINEDKGPDYPGPIPSLFGIIPGDASIYYSIPDYSMSSGKEIPSDETNAMRAWHCAFQLGIDSAKLVQKNVFVHLCNTDQNGTEATTDICGRCVFLSRQLDGVSFFSVDDEGEGAEGFLIEFGNHGQIRSFFLRWSNVEHYGNQPTASPQQIIYCIRAHKIMVLPHVNEEGYFARLRTLASVKKLTITKITPYYFNGVFGETPTNDVPSKFAMPIAILDAVADFGKSNALVQLYSPILSSDVNRLAP